MKLDPADLIRLTLFLNDDIDVGLGDYEGLISCAEDFYEEFGQTDWEKSEIDWESQLYLYYQKYFT